MAYVAFTDAETAYKAGGGQDFFRKMKDNFQSHEDRILPLESNMVFFDDFAFIGDGNNLSFESLEQPNESLDEIVHDPNYLIVAAGTTPGNVRSLIDPKPQWTVASITTAATPAWGAVFTKRNVRFDRIIKPITFAIRMKITTDVDFRVGIREFAKANPDTDQPGIWLERVDATNYRFVSYNTARNNGTPFAKPTVNTFFIMSLVFDSNTDHVDCKTDGLLRDTLVTQLPTDKILHGMFGLGGQPRTFHADSIFLSAKGALVAS